MVKVKSYTDAAEVGAAAIGTAVVGDAVVGDEVTGRADWNKSTPDHSLFVNTPRLGSTVAKSLSLWIPSQ